MPALQYWLWMTGLPGLSNEERLLLLRHFGSPEHLYLADSGQLSQVTGLTPKGRKALEDHSLDRAEAAIAACQNLKIQILTLTDAAYPGRLRDIQNPPCVLYIRGDLPAIDYEPVVAVVGTRGCTPYGRSCAREIGWRLAESGIVVASGMALGVDTAAAQGALGARGVTLGFAGCGLDVVYPPENEKLYADIAASGALISEYPPGTKPKPGHFPMRNRILSGMSLATVVVEAPPRSGALITAQCAVDQGRDVFAVPGPIHARESLGCNRLIQDGAFLLADPEDVVSLYAGDFPDRIHPGAARRRGARPASPAEPADQGPLAPPEPPQNPAWPNTTPEPPRPSLPAADLSRLTDDQIDLMRLLDPDTPVQMDELTERSGLPGYRVSSALTVLEVDGLVRQSAGKFYVRLAELPAE